jgi:transposase
MRENSAWPKTIGIDEHAFTRNKQRGHRDFVTLIVDYKNSKPKELLPTRNSIELQKMLAHIPGRENVKYITMDMSGTYRSFAKNFFPNASIIADHFHVVRLLHPAINRRRKQITGDKRKHPLRKLLLKNGKKLELFQRKAIYRWLEDYPELKDIYMAKEALHRLYRCRGHKRARSSLIKLLDWLADSQVEELKRLRKTLMNWKTEILNYFKNRITNAKTEGFNNVCKSMIKKAYGFRNFENYRLRVLNV